MVLGVWLHSALVFSPQGQWLITSSNTNAFMGDLVALVHTFRMPAFFVVSGYFCYLTLRKYQVKKFLSVRLKRLLIPLCFTALTLNSLQAWFLNYINAQTYVLPDYFLLGQYVSHLWFLVNLVIYFVVVSLAAAFLMPLVRIVLSCARWLLSNVPMLLLVVAMPLFTLAILASSKLGFPLYLNLGGVLDIYSIVSYFPYFAFGIALAVDTKFLARFCKLNVVVVALLILLVLALSRWINLGEGMVALVVSTYFENLIKWLSIILVFQLFYRCFNRPIKALRTLSDASYSVYLLHHCLVIALGFALVYLNFSAMLGFITLVSLVTVITLFLHTKVIANSKVLLYLFNGK